MVVANIFQAFQTFLLNKEALPENLQKILDQQLLMKNEAITTTASTISEKDYLLNLIVKNRLNSN